jgi:hypothetical protein
MAMTTVFAATVRTHAVIVCGRFIGWTWSLYM